jgi:hypothetical protein
VRLAPPGKAVVHAYTAGNEPYSVPVLQQLLLECCRGYHQTQDLPSSCLSSRYRHVACCCCCCCCCVQALERFIPDIRERTELCMVGTPLTHERFLRRHRGSYGEEGFCWLVHSTSRNQSNAQCTSSSHRAAVPVLCCEVVWHKGSCGEDGLL